MRGSFFVPIELTTLGGVISCSGTANVTREGGEMFRRIEEGVEIYKAEIRAYNLWLKAMKDKYGEFYQDPIGMWDTADYNKVVQWNEKIVGMEKSLGLSKAEIDQIGEEAKINPS